ncbi:Uncharacterized protein APZ42_009077, partial [Daphnia magna]
TLCLNYPHSPLSITVMKARGVARIPIPAPVRANKTKKGGEDFAIGRSESNSLKNKY